MTQQQQQTKMIPTRSAPTQKRRKSSKKGLHPPITVQHNYHDFADVAAPGIDHYAAMAKSGAVGNAGFPLKLYDMLERVEKEGYSHIVSWQPHGRCFVVHRPDDIEDLLPRYFKLSKIASFQRQLNLYGFLRITSGKDRGGYYHERLLRGKPFLIEGMTRAKVKGTVVRARSNPKQEPDFYRMSWVGSDNSCGIENYNNKNTAQRPVTSWSSSSLVSNDDNNSDVDIDFHELDLEPIPLSAIVSQSAPTPAEADVVLSGWGMPFHVMDDLPSDLPEPVPVGSSSSGFTQSQQYQAVDDSNGRNYDDIDQVLGGLLLDELANTPTSSVMV
jgi:hypothetical protein